MDICVALFKWGYCTGSCNQMPESQFATHKCERRIGETWQYHNQKVEWADRKEHKVATLCDICYATRRDACSRKTAKKNTPPLILVLTEVTCKRRKVISNTSWILIRSLKPRGEVNIWIVVK